MNANNGNPENLVAVCKIWKIHLYKLMGAPIIALPALDCDWSLRKFIEVNFSM